MKVTGSSPVSPTIIMIEKRLLCEEYYKKKLSMMGIAGILGITPATVVYWMKKHGLSRRSSNESAYVKQNPHGDPFNIKTKLTVRERELFLCGLMLYWAEGSRRNKHVVQLANLDNRMLLLFVKFLRIICGVVEEKLSLNVQLYREFDKTSTKKHWSKVLSIPAYLIAVNIHSDKRSKPTQQWSRYGIARIEVRNVKLKQWIDAALDEYLNKCISAQSK